MREMARNRRLLLRRSTLSQDLGEIPPRENLFVDLSLGRTYEDKSLAIDIRPKLQLRNYDNRGKSHARDAIVPRELLPERAIAAAVTHS